jgi:adenosylmethionine-8-amino-7-oxononanoate aminotransferase
VQAELAERVAGLAPGDLNRVFFTTGGGEAVESAWKAAKQYFKLIGKPLKHKVISRAIAYHGTPHGALAITGLPNMKKDFEPVAPGGFRVPNTNIYRHPEFADDPKAFGRWAADRIEEAILFEGPDTVAAVFLEPVQNSGGCFTPPPGYFERRPRDLRPARRPARLRRGHLRLRQARHRRSPARSSATPPTSSPAPRA